MKKYLEISDSTSTRFWSIHIEEKSYTVRYGKRGYPGRRIQKDFATEEAANQAFAKQLEAKKKQGYLEVDEETKEALESPEPAPAAIPTLQLDTRTRLSDSSFVHSQALKYLQYTHSGEHVVGFGESSYTIWEASTGTVLQTGYHGASSYSLAVAAHPQKDEFLVYGGYNGSGKIISLDTDETTSHSNEIYTLKECRGSIFAGHIDDESVYLTAQNNFQILQRSTHELVSHIQLPHIDEGTYPYGTFNADGSLLAYGQSNQGSIYILDTQTQEIRHTFEAKIMDGGIAFSPDGKWFAAFQTGKGLTVWDLQSGKESYTWSRWEWRVSSRNLQFSPDSQNIALVLNSKNICWSLSNPERELWVRGLHEYSEALTFVPHSTKVACSQERKVAFASLETGLIESDTLHTLRAYTHLFASTHSKQLYALTSGIENSHVIDTESLSLQRTLRSIEGVRSSSPKQHRILTRWNTGLALLSPESGKECPILPIEPRQYALGHDRIAVTLHDNYDAKWLRVFTLSGTLLYTLEDSKKSCPNGPLCFAPNDARLYGSKGKRLLVWNLETQERIHDLKEQPTSIKQMSVSPDGRWLATSDRYRNILIWDTQDFTVFDQHKADSEPHTLEWFDSETLLLHTSSALYIRDVQQKTTTRQISFGLSAQTSVLAQDNTLYLAAHDGSIHAMDLSSVLQPQAQEVRSVPFFDFTQLDPKSSLEVLETALREAPWEHFDPLRDTVALRRFLEDVEHEHGVRQIHYDCSDRVLRKNKRLLHPFGHKNAPIDEDISPCGRWLATGSWVGENYDKGGEIQIWERETGRCVNTLIPITGGVGWPDYPGQVQWSPDGTQLGLGFDTNGIGNFLPFSTSTHPMTHAYVTDGGNRPPDWEWTTDGRACIVRYGRMCIAPFLNSALDGQALRWFPDEDREIPEEYIKPYANYIDNTPDYGESYTFEPKPRFDYFSRIPMGYSIPSLHQSPLARTGKNIGRRSPIDPSFPILHEGRWHWNIAFDNGLVISSPELHDQLEQYLHFSIENRFAWPVSWADERHYAVTSTFYEATQHPLFPFSEHVGNSFRSIEGPKDYMYFRRTLPATENEYYNEYSASFGSDTYDLATAEASNYEAKEPFQGEALTQENVATLIGKAVAYQGPYDSRTQIGTLIGFQGEYAQIFYKSPSGSSYGMSGSDLSSLSFIGEAVLAEHGIPEGGFPKEEPDEQGERAQFPNGKNLSKLSSADNERGTLNIPLPFEGDGVLTLHWEKIFGFHIEEDFAEKWGRKFLKPRHDCLFLGHFTYNDEPLVPSGEGYWGAEHFHECRFDAHGNDYTGTNEDFNGEHGLNVTLLMSFVPKRTGQFKKETPVREIESIRFGSKGSYRINWSSHGGSKWTLSIDDEKLYSSEELLVFTSLSFEFDFYEMTFLYQHNYAPNELWNE